MNLREQVRQDNANILGDKTHGFAIPITIHDPAGPTHEVTGIFSHTAMEMDADTGITIIVNKKNVTISLSLLTGIEIKEGWKIVVDDNGEIITRYANVIETNNDLGSVTIMLRV